MVRFIIKMESVKYSKNATIYIPIWLDLLCRQYNRKKSIFDYLHSNMVRFIIFTIKRQTICLSTIYIPIWLDLL